MRGVKKVSATTITSAFTGVFEKNENKNEFYNLLNRKSEY